MIALTTGRTRRTRPLALLLLVIQGSGAGVVAVAHAGEHFSAPAHVEAHHDARCLVLHDELRCALCRYTASRAQARTLRPVAQAATPAQPCLTTPTVAPAWRPARLTSPPRAPPHSAR